MLGDEPPEDFSQSEHDADIDREVRHLLRAVEFGQPNHLLVTRARNCRTEYLCQLAKLLR
jgi:hypothetical protein